MQDRKENTIQNLGSTLFMVLFFIICFSFSGKSEKPSFNDAQYELVAGLHSSSVKAIVVDFIQMPVFHKSLMTSIDKMGFSFCNTKFKLSADNKNFAQQIIFLERSIPSLKPLYTCRFYYHLFSAQAKELPALS